MIMNNEIKKLKVENRIAVLKSRPKENERIGN